MSNPVGWFEIAVIDLERAMRFYEKVFGYPLQRNTSDKLDMAIFPMESEGKGAMGALVRHKEFYVPSKEGTLVYFTAKSGDLQNELDNVEPAGGRVVVPKTKISDEHGFMAVFLDSEGNRVAMHSRK